MTGAHGWGRALLGRPVMAPPAPERHKDGDSVPLGQTDEEGLPTRMASCRDPRPLGTEMGGYLARGTSGVPWPIPEHPTAAPRGGEWGTGLPPAPAVHWSGQPRRAARTKPRATLVSAQLPGSPRSAQSPRVCTGGMGRGVMPTGGGLGTETLAESLTVPPQLFWGH